MLKRTLTILSILVMVSLVFTSLAFAQGPTQADAERVGTGGPSHIKAAAVFENLNDGDDSNDPYILDVRQGPDYELAHVPGAVNIGVTALFNDDNLASLPTDKQIVVYCYTGQTSSQAVSALKMLGYDAASMSFGFPSWNSEYLSQQAGPQPYNREVDGHDYRTETDANTAEGGQAPAAALAAYVDYFGNGTKNTKSSAIFENLNDGDDSNNPFIIDVRSAEDYAAGHIPGAINDPSGKTLFTADGLAQIPADQQVAVNCYTGQTASQVTSMLNLLGYDASNVKFGFASWSPSGNYSFSPDASPNYRVEGSGEPMMAEEEATMEESTEAADAAETTEEATTEEAAPAADSAAQPAQLPATGGIPFNPTLLYLMLGSGMVGAGALLRRK